jgi:hypothetical protein
MAGIAGFPVAWHGPTVPSPAMNWHQERGPDVADGSAAAASLEERVLESNLEAEEKKT